ncbi:MAG: GAF domain-containing protein [Anaerolineaceae bacterium]|nr:GAF domain-containing protein [Anaerolineaceae bacterium]
MITLTHEQLEERLAALHRASLELVQDISLESLLERIAIVACEQVKARYAAVGVLNENGELEQFIPIGMNPAEISKMTHPPRGTGLIGALMNTRQTIRLANIADDPRSVGFPPHHPSMSTFLGVPIRLGESQLGQIYLTEKSDGSEFSHDDEIVIETLAAYAAVAISNARLYKELRQRDRALTRRTDDLTLLNELASKLTSEPDIDEILNSALDRTVGYISVISSEIHLRNEDSNILHLVAHRDRGPGRIWNRDSFELGQGLVGTTAQTGQMQAIRLADEKNTFLRKTVLKSDVQQILCFPLTSRSGILGVLTIASRYNKPFSETELQLMTSLGSWTATAIENLRLNIKGKRLAILEERERIAMDLHDGIIQSIYAVGLTLEHARLLLAEDVEQTRVKILESIEGLNSTIRDIRAYIMDLKPRQLVDENLENGIGRLIKEFESTSQIEATLVIKAQDLNSIPAGQAIALFHICQEALGNASKHSRAQYVEVYVWRTDDRVVLEVTDNGLGFEQEKVNSSLGHGLSNMQTRAKNAGGDIEITTELGRGTTIMAWVPV